MIDLKVVPGKPGAKPSWFPFPDDETKLYTTNVGAKVRSKKWKGKRWVIDYYEADWDYIRFINKEYLYIHTEDKSNPDLLAKRALNNLSSGLVAEGACIDHGRPVLRDRYGRMVIARKNYRVHRVAFAAANGLIVGDMPADMVIMHACDNPRCVNPEHLYTGTYSLNAQDMILKGRGHWQQATPHHNSKLSIEDVCSIYKLTTSEEANLESIAKKYGVKYNTVWKIKNKLSWKSLLDKL